MIKTQIQNEALTRLIKSLFAKDRTTINKSFELTNILLMVNKLLDTVDMYTTIECLFEAFAFAHYPMNVSEPLHEDKSFKPYVNTNSHAIYIGIDEKMMKKAYTLLKFLKKKKLTIPNEYKVIFDDLILYK